MIWPEAVKVATAAATCHQLSARGTETYILHDSLYDSRSSSLSIWNGFVSHSSWPVELIHPNNSELRQRSNRNGGFFLWQGLPNNIIGPSAMKHTYQTL